MVGSTKDTPGPSSLRGQRAVMLDTLLRNLRMVRLRAAANMFASVATVVSLAAIPAMGCTGTIGGGDGSDDVEETPEAAAARVAWERTGGAYDAFSASGCISCHAVDVNYPFLAGADKAEVRATLLEFQPNPVINLEAPSSSRTLIKGPHTGPSLAPADAAAILDWINKEQISAGVETGGSDIVIEPFEVVICTAGANPCPINYIDLAPLGLEGATISFVVQPLSTMLYVTSLQVNPGPAGVHMEHPLFSSWPDNADVKPDPIDRFFSTEVNIQTGEVAQLDGGAAGFSSFSPTDKIGVSFSVLEPWFDDGGTVVDDGNCKALATFVSAVKPQFQANCAGCHSGGGAQGALDMSMLANDEPYSCAQTLNRISTVDIPTSAIFLAADPSSGTNHPFKFGGNQGNYDNYETAVTPWIEAERDAP